MQSYLTVLKIIAVERVNFSKMEKCSRMRTPRLSRRLPAVRLGYVAEMH